MRIHPITGRVLLQSASILVLSAGLGFITQNRNRNALESAGYGREVFQRREASVWGDEKPAIRQVSVGEANALKASKDVVFLDARARSEFEIQHIASARSLPSDQFDECFARQLSLFAGKKAFVVYCGGEGCRQSSRVAEWLRDMGIDSVMIFAGGWKEWKGAGLPIEP